MVAWMNEEALDQTLSTGVMTFWSRSRQEIWVKGATSGNTQRLLRLELDCDGDALLAIVEESGPACHNGTDSCFDSHVFIEGEAS
jgi:phosphoribosyl-AMP cyclohydrolase